jgi:glycosyltransferase involved in cell wall biosynthesis
VTVSIETVVILNDFCHAQGGASRVAIDEAIALRALGIDVRFVGAVGPVCQELRDNDVAVLCLDQPELAEASRRPRAALAAIWNLAAYRATRALLETIDNRRTVVHLHGYTKALSTAPAVAARHAGFAVLCTLHDFFAACPNGAFFNYRSQEPCRLRALSAGCLLTACDKRRSLHKAYRVVRGLTQRHVARFPAAVGHYIALSRHSAQLMRPYLPAGATIYPLPNIIDVEHAPPVDPGANTDLMVVGRLDEEKGVLLAASAATAAGLPIVFVGDGPLRAKLEATGARVTGWLPAAEVWRELATARCLVFPSLWYETFGLVVSEAAARGVPAIVSQISAPADRVINGVTGWLFRSGDRDDLIRRMAITRGDAAVRTAGAAAWSAYWASPADPASHARELLGIYEAVLGSDVVTPGAEAADDTVAPVGDATPATEAACAANLPNATCQATASRSVHSANTLPSAIAAACAIADAEPNHATAEQ